MTVPAIQSEIFPNRPEKRESSKLGLMLAALGVGVAACGRAMASVDNFYGQKRSLPRPINAGLIGSHEADQSRRSANLLFPGFDYGNIRDTAERLAPYIGENGAPVGFIDNNTGAFSPESTVRAALEFAKTNNLDHATLIGLSAGGMTATEVAAAYNQTGIKTDLIYFASPFSAKDIYLGQRTPLWLAALWGRTGINFGPTARVLYESMRLSYEVGFGVQALRRALVYTKDQHTPPNSSIFGRASNIFAHHPERFYSRLSPDTRAVDIFADKLKGDGTIKNRQAADQRTRIFGDRHLQIPVSGIGHMDIESKFEVYGESLRSAIQWLGQCATTSVINPPLVESSETVQVVKSQVLAA